jgi:hypothetical protein
METIMIRRLLTWLLDISKPVHTVRLGDLGSTTHSILRIESDGQHHELLFGKTMYAMGTSQRADTKQTR